MIFFLSEENMRTEKIRNSARNKLFPINLLIFRYFKPCKDITHSKDSINKTVNKM